MKLNKKAAVILGGVLSITIASGAALRTPPEPAHYTNLKVLPKDISSKELQSIMTDDFEDALGVSCGFCHANNANGHGLDFASDAKAEKEITRVMMRMTLGISKKYLKIKHPRIGNSMMVVSCYTCHKGAPFSDDVAK
ncbi:c-type cytochrome [Mucilaginibacter sp. dw_454]|uniref:c-type cytochrome n=1 Tax=Mucilaginibacter sp. dw_454 TaxID=2720079 RepID=UPI001BD6076C|nr:c-type cytochrome [Mucilaginibacter sp. dw_454]